MMSTRLIPCLVLIGLLAACSAPRIIVLDDPLDAWEHNDLGVSYEQRGEYDLAAREYERAARLDKTWSLPLINLGNVRAARQNWKEAEADYLRALRREPGSAAAQNNLAWVLLQDGRAREALPRAEQAVVRAPGEAAYLDTLAEIQIALEQYTVARQSLKKALALNPPPQVRQRLETLLKEVGPAENPPE